MLIWAGTFRYWIRLRVPDVVLKERSESSKERPTALSAGVSRRQTRKGATSFSKFYFIFYLFFIYFLFIYSLTTHDIKITRRLLRASLRSFRPPTSTAMQHLRSASRHKLNIPRFRCNTFGTRAFLVAGPTISNSLSDSLRDPDI